MLGDLVIRAADLAWGPWTLCLLLGSGLWLTWRLRCVQLARLPAVLRAAIPTGAGEGGGLLSPFQAFTTALAASIGTGNIAGVATAIVSGGPGALFWIWVYGFCAAAIKFTEAVLGVTYRADAGERVGTGPMYYLRDGLGSPALATVYALVAGIAALTTTPFAQPNSIAVVLEARAGIPPLATGVGLCLLTGVVLIGGIHSIGAFAARLAPAKVLLYVGGGLWVIGAHLGELPGVQHLVVSEAFSLQATAGGGLGILVAMRYGVARGIYANEAGYGTAAVAYGTARSREPLQQGLAAIAEVYVVSFVTSTISGLAILLTGAWRSGLTSTAAVAQAFEGAMPGVGAAIVVFCACLFGYTTLVGWSYYGEQALEYVLGVRVRTPYRWLYCALVVVGAQQKVEVVWAWGDLMNGLQVLPNMVGVLALSAVAAATLRAPGAGAGR